MLWRWCLPCVTAVAQSDDAPSVICADICEEWFDKEWNNQFRDEGIWRQLHSRAAAGEFDAWATSEEPLERLALVLLLDQITRSIYGGTREAYDQDEVARAAAARALEDGRAEEIPPPLRMFLYFPLMHSENLADQERANAGLVRLARSSPDESSRLRLLEEATGAHLEAVQLFGRLPERNKVLGRQTTREEADFLRRRPTC